MLIGHLSDSHLGASPYNLKEREEDFYEAFDEAIETMVKDRVQMIIHAGDIFDTPKPGGTPLVRLVNQLKVLREKGIRFLFTLGEHDISRLPGIPSPLIYERVDLATYIGQGNPVECDGITVVGFHKHRKTEIDDLREKLKSLDGRLSSAPGKKILVLHQGMVEFHKYAGELVSADLPKTFDYYAMGHLHDHYEGRFDLLGGPLCYPGSLDATASEGIHEYKKGFYVTDLSGEEAKPDWIELKSLRKEFAPVLAYDNLEKDVTELTESIRNLSKKPLLNLSVKGKDIDSARVASVLKSLQDFVLYYVWQRLDVGNDITKQFEEKPQDIEEEMLRIAAAVTGRNEGGSFSISELLPLLVEQRVDEATELLWSAFKNRRFDAK